MPLDPVARREIVEAVQRVKARYFRYIDQQNWTEFPGLFTEDVEIDVTDDMQHMGVDPARGITVGRDRFARNVARSLDGVRTVHHGHMPEIDVVAPDHARAIWAMHDRLEFPDGRVQTGDGHYDEEYRLVDGEWRIARMKLVRLRIARTERSPARGEAAARRVAREPWTIGPA
jgi:SnoaL-like domain